MFEKIKKASCAALCIVLAGALTFAVSAWFSAYWAGSDVVFQPGSNAALPEIDMWMYNSVEDLASDNTLTAGWVRVPDKTATNSYGVEKGVDEYILPSAPMGNEGNSVTFTLNQLHFGVVDNLISLKEDNIIYVRLTVDAQKTGASLLTVDFDYLQDVPTVEDLYSAVTLYGTKVAGGNIELIDGEDLKSIITFPAVTGTNNADTSDSRSQFMQIACAVTKNASIVPGGTGNNAITNLDFGEDFTVIGNTLNLDLTDTLGDAYTGIYYVYLKIAPRLEFFVSQENLLDQFVPSYIFFDTKLKIELH